MFNFTMSRIASEVRDSLSSLVTTAKTTAPADEHSLIELAGQAAHVALDGVDDDVLVDLQAYGSEVKSTGARVFFVSMNAKPIRTKDATTVPTVKPWTPDQGPLALRTPST
jgi:hypothetical protein